MWCLVHASWIHNRYATSSGQTGYERAFDSPYQGRICQFGEVVLANYAQAGQGSEEITEVVGDVAEPEPGAPNPSLPAR